MHISIRCQVNIFHMPQNLLISGRSANCAMVVNVNEYLSQVLVNI